jgi:hypothetical protein
MGLSVLILSSGTRYVFPFTICLDKHFLGKHWKS